MTSQIIQTARQRRRVLSQRFGRVSQPAVAMSSATPPNGAQKRAPATILMGQVHSPLIPMDRPEMIHAIRATVATAVRRISHSFPFPRHSPDSEVGFSFPLLFDLEDDDFTYSMNLFHGKIFK